MADVPKLNLNQKLRRVRENFRLTHAEMAEELNGYGLQDKPLSAEMIMEFENEEREPTIRVVRAYAKFHGMPIDSLINNDIQPFP